MREHMGLFRGKRIYNGEWVEGFFLRDREFYGNIEEHSYIVNHKHPSGCFGRDIYFEVDPDTVGECTGLRDKNGKLIFEGDIVKGHCHSAWSHHLQRCVVAYGRDGFEARHHIDGIDSEYYTHRVLFSKDVVVAGNVHDNPELLKGGEGDG